jgi:hypothetical protein
MPKKMTIQSLAGLKFSRWTVLPFCGVEKIGRWRCLCECGTSRIVRQYSLIHGISKSCGCLTRRKITHGESRFAGNTAEYGAWSAMKSRCSNPNVESFKRYGGRGISFCDRWISYENFLADMGRRPSEKHSIDRINGNGNYEPGNCRWATRKEQQQNIRTNLKITINGETLVASQWEVRQGFKPDLISKRISQGWSPEEAVLTPVRPRLPNRRQRA